MDIVFIRGLRLEAQIGIYRRERTTSQPIEVDLEIGLPDTRVFSTGKVSDTVDYGQVAERLGRAVAETRYGLVEEMAEAFASILLDEFRAPWVKVTIAKLGILRDTARVGISIQRSNVRAASGEKASDANAAAPRPNATAFNPNWQSKDSPSGSNPFADSDTSP